MLLFLSRLPSVGFASLKMREDPKLLGVFSLLGADPIVAAAALGACVRAWLIGDGCLALPCLAWPPYRPGAGTDKEVTLLKPDNQFYKDFALDCSRQQIAVDLFLFSPHYTDVATLSTAFPPPHASRQRWFVRGEVNRGDAVTKQHICTHARTHAD